MNKKEITYCFLLLLLLSSVGLVVNHLEYIISNLKKHKEKGEKLTA